MAVSSRAGERSLWGWGRQRRTWESRDVLWQTRWRLVMNDFAGTDWISNRYCTCLYFYRKYILRCIQSCLGWHQVSYVNLIAFYYFLRRVHCLLKWILCCFFLLVTLLCSPGEINYSDSVKLSSIILRLPATVGAVFLRENMFVSAGIYRLKEPVIALVKFTSWIMRTLLHSQ